MKRKFDMKIYEACMEYPPDLGKIKSMLNELKDQSVLYNILSVNEEDPEIDRIDNLISVLCLDYLNMAETDRDNYPEEWDEKYCVQIIRLLLDNGFDVDTYNGKVGADCLRSLLKSGFRRYLAMVGGMLLDAGADPTIKDGDGENLADRIRNCLETEKPDNRDQLEEYLEMCEKEIRKRKGKEHPLNRKNHIRKLDREWKQLETLRIIDCDLSGEPYPSEYARTHKRISDRIGWGGGMTAVLENVELKRSVEGILYREIGRGVPQSQVVEYDTCRGKFLLEDCGEFGGEMTLPDGKKINGNFNSLFELQGQVYAIDSGEHLSLAHFNLYRIDKTMKCRCLYSVGGIDDWLRLKQKQESEEYSFIPNLCYVAADIKETEAYLLINGQVDNMPMGTGKFWDEERILRVSAESDHVEEVLCLAGKITMGAKSILVEGKDLYISGDKMVVKINLETKEKVYMTWISEEDEQQIQSLMKEGDIPE